MGLDQSIFTTSKAVAQAIYNGNIVNDGMWNPAFFSLRNIKETACWTDMDRYAKNRRAQFGLLHETIEADDDALPAGTFVAVGGPLDVIDPEEREANLQVVEAFGASGAASIAGEPAYQIGLFHQFNGLHGWFQRVAGEMTMTCDGMVVLTADILNEIMLDAVKVLQAFDKSQEYGEQIAKETFPTCDGFFFGGTEYDDIYLADLGMLAAFAYSVLQLPGSADALFSYNPWW